MAIATHGLSGERVLIVEDDYYVATDLSAGFKALAIEVIGPVASVEDAQQCLEKGEITAAVLDIQLGDDTVFGFADSLELSGIPFVFATGFGSYNVPRRHKNRILLLKPLEPAAVVAALSDALGIEPALISQARQNKVFSSLSQADLETLLPTLFHQILPRGMVLEQRGCEIDRVYFPIEAIASVITWVSKTINIETGLIGFEGLTGQALLVSDEKAAYDLIAQVGGAAISMSADHFKAARESIPEFGVLATSFSRSLSIQVSYGALANVKLSVIQRLARWILMMDDRHRGDDIEITHDYLSVMLGVRRSGVTDAIHLLEGQHLVRSKRIKLSVRDRNGLIEATAGVYGPPEAHYRNLMGNDLRG